MIFARDLRHPENGSCCRWRRENTFLDWGQPPARTAALHGVEEEDHNHQIRNMRIISCNMVRIGTYNTLMDG